VLLAAEFFPLEEGLKSVGAYDVIVIGAGHNGLVTAAYLAKAGRRVLVLEKRDIVGGAAVTEEIFPGFRVSTVADGGGYLSPRVRDDLKLDSRVETVQSDAVAFCPQPDGTQLTIWRDTDRTAEEIARFSRADASAYPGFVELMSRIADVMRGLMEMTPPDLPEVGRRDLRGGLGLFGPLRRLGRKNISELLRILPMPSDDLLNEYFESPAVKAAIGATSVLNVSWGPREAGTAYTLLCNWALAGTGLFRSAGVVKGGMGALTGAIADAARGFGAEIRTGTPVERAVVENGRATGVVLESGETLTAPVIVSNADPRTTFEKLLEPRYLDVSFMRHVRNIKYRGSAVRIHLALRELPAFTAISSNEDIARLRGPIQIAPSLDTIQRAFDCSKYGRSSDHPVLDILIPTLSDPSLAPEGQHLMSITARYAPYALRDGTWDDHKEAFSDLAIETLAGYVPGIHELILHRHILAPTDLESEYGLPEGNPNHGEMTLDQFFHMRPIPGYARYRTPVAGLYMCGAGCHPGGGVTGIPGHNAAREILKDAI
jgi:phytoene dehydrogenase-like protein